MGLAAKKRSSSFVDGCTRSFRNIATRRLPTLLKRLRAMEPIPMRWAQDGRRRMREALGIGKTNASGCYVLYDGKKPFYVGIAGDVPQRLRQHVSGGLSHASLAFKMAKRERSAWAKSTYGELRKQKSFMAAFERQKNRLAQCHVRVVAIDDHVELYLFEVYAALALRTGRWNSFKTH